MPGPIESLRFVHAAILAEADWLEAEVAAAPTPAAAGELADRIREYGALVDGHTRGEEAGLFPPLVERDPAIAETYLYDHVEERATFDELAALADRCREGDEQALVALRRGAVALATHAHSHVGKENELIIPRVAEAFTFPEQAAIVGDVLAVFTPEETAHAIPWIIARLDADTAAAYVAVLAHALPPEKFAVARGWIQGGISAEQWEALVEREPTLAGA